MKVILVMVMSVDGKTTRWDEPSTYQWTSKEDQQYFSDLIKQAPVIIMGRKTYEAAKSIMKHNPNKLRIIITSQPDKFSEEAIPNQLEFTNNSPEQIVEELSKRKYEQILLVGGSQVNTAFLEKKLVSELWLTIEPKLFGSGNPLVGTSKLETDLQLLSSEKLNEQGTLLLKYKLL